MSMIVMEMGERADCGVIERVSKYFYQSGLRNRSRNASAQLRRLQNAIARDYENMLGAMNSVIRDYDKIGKRNRKKETADDRTPEWEALDNVFLSILEKQK